MNMMQTILQFLGLFLLAAGGILLAIAAWGVHALPNALSRQHAATKAATLAIATACVGACLLHPNWNWLVRLGLVLLYLMLSLPLSAHMLARAAVTETETDTTPHA